MRYYLFLLLLFFYCCQSSKQSDSLNDVIAGNWFIIYPDEENLDKEQEKIYGRIQDSLVTLKGLKLVSFMPNGDFVELDSLPKKGRWGIKENEVVYVAGAGKGFNDFKTTVSHFEKGDLQLTETVSADGRKMNITWHLKKLDKGEPATLFDADKNKWREKPNASESDTDVKKRLVAMLRYYAIYFKLIAKESSYFMPSRVMLPIGFYQHAISVKAFDAESKFVKLFYSLEQGRMAHTMLKGSVERVTFSFKEKNSYSEEYSLMLGELADDLEKLKL
jgi:hypothetical protein